MSTVIDLYNGQELLVVDDNLFNLKLITQILNTAGFKVRPATGGELALKSIKAKHPSLILLDEKMPGMSGIEVCKTLKASPDTCDIPVIFISALDDKASKVRCFEAGGADFITKPFEAEEVLARVRTHLQLKFHQDHLQELVALQTASLVKAKEATIASMAIMSEFRDTDTGRHIQRTKHYVALLIEELVKNKVLKLEREEIALMVQSVPLHDIGKVGISDAILYKQDRLSPQEFEEMKRHTIYGYDAIVRTEETLGYSSFLKYARELARSHHEKWDGTGYPDGLKQEDIPISARMMMLADTYDALRSKRPYKEAYSHEKAFEILMNGDDRLRPEHFDPMLLEVFRNIHYKFEAISNEFSE